MSKKGYGKKEREKRRRERRRVEEANKRREEEQSYEAYTRAKEIRTKTWSPRRIYSFFKKKLKALKEKSAEKQYENVLSIMVDETTLAKNRIDNLQREKELARQKGIKESEYKRYAKYLKKEQRILDRPDSKVIKRMERGVVKVAHHEAEIARVKKILYGDIASIA